MLSVKDLLKAGVISQEEYDDYTNPKAQINPAFAIKDSGKRNEFESGMVRDTEEGKIDYTLILDGPMYDRWAEHLTKGAVKYDARNWMKADGEKELERARRSLSRHYRQYMRGDVDEDHGAAIIFNINQIEYIKERMSGCVCDTCLDAVGDCRVDE